MSISAVGLLVAALPTAAAANQPPTITLIEDTIYTGTKSSPTLASTVADDSLPVDQLTILWRQIQGPVAAVVLVPSNPTTAVSFPDSGHYRFELSVSDGQFTTRDTVTAVVHISLPFGVLHPSNGEEVEIGTAFVIRWQMDPSMACEVAISIDTGRTWDRLTTLGAKRDSMVWQVDTGYADRTSGLISVWQYEHPSNKSNEGEFVLVKQKNPIRNRRPDLAGPGRMRVWADRSGRIRLTRAPRDQYVAVSIYNAEGGLVLRARGCNGAIGRIGESGEHSLIYCITGTRGNVLARGFVSAD